MSEGLVNIAGSPTVEIALAGDIYRMSAVTLLHDRELENHILRLKASPLEAIEKLPPLPQKPKPIIKRSDETPEDYAVRYREHTAEKNEWQRRVSQRDALTAQAFQEASKPRVVTIQDQMHFLQTTEATFFRLWLSLKKNHPELETVDHVKDLCQRHEEWAMVNGVEENMFGIIDDKLQEAAMESALKNFGGRATKKPASPANVAASPGVGFTQTSPVSMDTESTTSTN